MRRACAVPCSDSAPVRGRSPRGACARELGDIGASRFSVGPSQPPLGDHAPQVKQAMSITIRDARLLPWLLYAGNRLAPICRKRSGSFMPKTSRLLYAGSPVAPLCRKVTLTDRVRRGI